MEVCLNHAMEHGDEDEDAALDDDNGTPSSSKQWGRWQDSPSVIVWCKRVLVAWLSEGTAIDNANMQAAVYGYVVGHEQPYQLTTCLSCASAEDAFMLSGTHRHAFLVHLSCCQVCDGSPTLLPFCSSYVYANYLAVVCVVSRWSSDDELAHCHCQLQLLNIKTLHYSESVAARHQPQQQQQPQLSLLHPTHWLVIKWHANQVLV